VDLPYPSGFSHVMTSHYFPVPIYIIEVFTRFLLIQRRRIFSSALVFLPKLPAFPPQYIHKAGKNRQPAIMHVQMPTDMMTPRGLVYAADVALEPSANPAIGRSP